MKNLDAERLSEKTPETVMHQSELSYNIKKGESATRSGSATPKGGVTNCNNMLIALDICNTKCEKYLSSGRIVHFPYVSDVRVQDYTPGTDLIIDPLTATDSSLTVNKSKAATFTVDPIEVKQALAPWAAQVAYQSAFQLRNNIDQTVISNGITRASTSVTAGSVSTSSILNLFNDRRAQLFRNNATDDSLFAIIDADRLALLTQTFVANGFQEADAHLRRQFVGEAAGFQVYVTNNLPSTVQLTMPTIPVAADTFTMFGITFTWTAAGAAVNPGDIAIGANVAASKANFLLMVAGTAAGGAATYIDLAVEDRRKLQNAQLTASAWGATLADTCDLTYFGKMAPTEAITPADAVWLTETTSLLFGRMGAPSLAIQMQPELYVRPEPKQITDNYITHVLYGAETFFRDRKRMTKAIINA